MPTQSGPRLSIAVTNRCPNGSMIDISLEPSLCRHRVATPSKIASYVRRAIARFNSDTSGGPE